MDSQQEQQCSQAMRELARQYADGRFNKEEYRNRRRELIARCSGEMPAEEPESPLQNDPPEPADQLKAMRVLRVVAMTCVALMVLMGAIIVYLR